MDGPGNDQPVEELEAQPDYRFTLANERTFLAWIRTALGLLAGAVAIVAVVPHFGFHGARQLLGTTLTLMAMVVTLGAVHRWRVVQAAMRRGEDLPPSRMPALLAAGLAVLSAFLVLLLLIWPGG